MTQDGPVVAVVARDDTPPYYLAAYGAEGTAGTFRPEGTWYYNFQLAAEDARGFSGGEDAYQIGHFAVTLQPGESAHVIAAVEREQAEWVNISGALEREQMRRQTVMTGARRDPGRRRDGATAPRGGRIPRAARLRGGGGHDGRRRAIRGSRIGGGIR